MQALDASQLSVPDVVMHLHVVAPAQAVLEDPLDELLVFELSPDHAVEELQRHGRVADRDLSHPATLRLQVVLVTGDGELDGVDDQRLVHVLDVGRSPDARLLTGARELPVHHEVDGVDRPLRVEQSAVGEALDLHTANAEELRQLVQCVVVLQEGLSAGEADVFDAELADLIGQLLRRLQLPLFAERRVDSMLRIARPTSTPQIATAEPDKDSWYAHTGTFSLDTVVHLTDSKIVGSLCHRLAFLLALARLFF